MSTSLRRERWSFLSGLPERARRERIVVAMRAYVDESGGKNQTAHFSMAGLIGTTVAWEGFAEEWDAALRKPPAVKVLKMTQAASCVGHFHGMSLEERDQKLWDLALVLSRGGISAIHCTTDLAGFEESIGSKSVRPFRDPYFFPFHLMIVGVCLELLSRGQQYRFEIVFDENLIFGPRAKAWYPLIKGALMPEDAQAIMPAEPVFRPDDDEPALQAADMLAWFFREMSAEPRDTSWDWLLPRLFTLPVSRFSTSLVGDRWRARYEALYPQTVIDKVVNRYEEMFGAL